MERISLKILIFVIFTASIVSAKCPENTSVLIVGAGAAGIAALSHFVKEGYTNVVLLEASNRIGGRINTVRDGDIVLDLGAQWIHGDQGNIIYELIQNQDLTDITPHEYSTGEFISSEGNRKADYSSIFDMCHDIVSETTCDNVPPQSYRNFFMNKYNEEIKKGQYEEKDMKDVVRFYEKQFCVDEASDNWSESTTSTCKHYEELDGPEAINWKDNGFSTVFDFITRKRPNPQEDLKVEQYIELNKEVTKINWCNGNQIKVKCKDGSLYKAQHVIVTIPLGVLKATHKSMFHPRLPRRKLRSIRSLNFGTFDKIILIYDNPFWTEDFNGTSLIWTEEGIRDVAGTDLEWITGVIGFYRVSYQPRVLAGWIVGPKARAMECLSEDQLKKGVAKIFEKFLTPLMTTTPPNKVITSKWHSNPYSRGSYSARSLTTDRMGGSAKILSNPLRRKRNKKPLVLFAGEATHPNYYSSAHGAIETGIREADRLIDSC